MNEINKETNQPRNLRENKKKVRRKTQHTKRVAGRN
jgi:hypothetical protein